MASAPTLSFVPRPDLPRPHPDVRVGAVTDRGAVHDFEAAVEALLERRGLSR